MSADSLYNPYKWYGPQTPLRMFKKNIPPKKNKKKIHDKAVQSNILWLNLNKINEINFYHQQINKVTPHFTFMRRAQNADTHALKQHRLSQNISPSAPVLYWLSHLTCISSLKAKNERKTLIYTHLNISRYKQLFFAIFRWSLRNWPPAYLL